MSPCNVNDVSFDLPDGPSGIAIPGYGTPFSLDLPNINPFPEGFPEDLLDLLNKLNFLIPPGILKPHLNPNFGKDIFDGIMKLLDQFLPFLMMYKFFLPLLKLILCVIEVLCAIPNPRKLIRAMKKLFRRCIPDFLNLFPIFALIMMIISLLLLLLALIEYLINQIIKLIKTILRNLMALHNAFTEADDTSILAIAKKIGALLCIFQNFFVLFALFDLIIQVFRDILSMVFAIPACDDSDTDGCCTTDVCSDIVKTQVQRYTGKIQYFSNVKTSPPFSSPIPLSPELSAQFSPSIRTEGWQLYDEEQSVHEAFRNIYDGYDVTVYPKPVFFPNDAVYNAATPPAQAPYTLDIKFFYNPINWSRTISETNGRARWVQFKDCIMTSVPTNRLFEYDNTTQNIYNGVVKLAGGLGYEDDGETVLKGYEADGITISSTQATLENFLHEPAQTSLTGVLLNDGYLITDVEYILKPNLPVLVSKDLVTIGCIPDIAIDRTFVNNALVGQANMTSMQVVELMKEENGFPSPMKAQECLTTALSGLRGNLTVVGVAQFQAITSACLAKLKEDTENALGGLIGLGFDPCSSNFTLSPSVQFTSRPITIEVNLNERNGTSITSNLSPNIATNIAQRLKAHIDSNKGDVSPFTYDGYQVFTAFLSSEAPVIGKMSVSFDDQIFCTNTIPSDIDVPPEHTLQALDYRFVYTPAGITEGDATSKPRRDEGDLARGAGNK